LPAPRAESAAAYTVFRASTHHTASLPPLAATCAVRITPENEHLLRSGYEARRPSELPVLGRWFPRGSVPPPPAPILDIILYTREQIHLERAARG
jgi:Protein of unknown function (DUF3228)